MTIGAQSGKVDRHIGSNALGKLGDERLDILYAVVVAPCLKQMQLVEAQEGVFYVGVDFHPQGCLPLHFSNPERCR